MDADLREQLEISKLFLEHSHGTAVEYGGPDEAKAHYEAIRLIDDALEGNWDAEEFDAMDDEMFRELVDASREARAEGYDAAVLLDEARAQHREKYSHRPTLLERLLSWVSGV